MRDAIIALVFALIAVIRTTIFHLEALSVATRFSLRRCPRSVLVAGVLTLVILVHLIEITGYAIVYWIADVPLDIGSISGEQPHVLDMFYFTAEIYSSLGLNDIMPHGALRPIGSIGSIIGILLLAWSGAYLFAFADQLGRERFSGD